MDRVLLMGYLEEMHAFTEADIHRDQRHQRRIPAAGGGQPAPAPEALPGTGLGSLPQELRTLDQRVGERRASSVEVLDERMMRLEKSIVSVLSILKKIVATPQGAVTQPMDNQE
jgi:general secretion pathway protein A